MSEKTKNMRVLFCFGVSQALFDVKAAELSGLLQVIIKAYENLEERFGIKILGNFDDDQIMMGPSEGAPWTAYLLADVPDYETVVKICTILREAEWNGYRLVKFMKVEARVGRSLFFANN